MGKHGRKKIIVNVFLNTKKNEVESLKYNCIKSKKCYKFKLDENLKKEIKKHEIYTLQWKP